MHMGAAAGILALGAFLVGLGLALATDYRGVATWHSGLSVRSSAWLKRVPPWSLTRLARRTYDEDAAWALRLDRIIGAVFAAAGIAIFVEGIAVLFGWASSN